MERSRMEQLARRADTQSVEDLATGADTEEGREVAQAELDRRGK